jgi:acyl transferase domain-containing protein/acyl carrier protein
MPERLALVVSNRAELKQKLGEIFKGGESSQVGYRNNVTNNDAKRQIADGVAIETSIQALIERGELSKLAELWVNGAKIDWRLLHKPDVPRRISVPTYPFARERYWVPASEGKATEKRRHNDPTAAAFFNGATKAVSEGGKDPLKGATGQEEIGAGLQSFVPVWNPARLETKKRLALPESTRILLFGNDITHLDWVRKSYPNSELMELVSPFSVDVIEKKLGDCSFDQLLWIAPDVNTDACRESGSDEMIIERQEKGVVAVFRIIKALLQLGYANRNLQWTFVTGRTQRVLEGSPIQPTHAGIVGLIGCLAKEYPRWDLKLLDVDSLSSVTAEVCLSLPWDKQGNVLAHSRGGWFREGMALTATLRHTTSLYRQNGVYVVIGGAGGIGEVWSRFMMKHYQARVVWIGRRQYDAAIEEKINSLTSLGPAPLYISADAANLAALEQAMGTILKTYPAIHGVVHSALVLHDQTIARMDESAFRAGLSAKVDVCVNMDKVFGGQELDFMLFFSSIVSFVRPAGQSNYSAGCAFKDSFALMLQRQRPYPVKIMNWGYWGDVGVASDEFHRKRMAQIGLGSIEPQEGMASLEALMNSETRQVALIKTLDRQIAGAEYAEAKVVVATQKPLTGNGAPPSAEQPEETITNYIRQIITERLAEDLIIDAALVRNDAPLQDYGVDSIVGVNLGLAISEALGIQLEAASLLEYNTVNRLTEHILTDWRSQISGRLERVGGASQEPNHSTTNSDHVLEMVLLQEALLDDSYEKVTF